MRIRSNLLSPELLNDLNVTHNCCACGSLALLQVMNGRSSNIRAQENVSYGQAGIEPANLLMTGETPEPLSYRDPGRELGVDVIHLYCLCG